MKGKGWVGIIERGPELGTSDNNSDCGMQGQGGGGKQWVELRICGERTSMWVVYNNVVALDLLE